MPSGYLDLLLVLDEQLRHDALGVIPTGYEVRQVARANGLGEGDEGFVPRCIGRLVEDGYVKYADMRGGAARRSVPFGAPWNDTDLQSFGDYRITAKGREEAERVRRESRQARTDAALGLGTCDAFEIELDERAAAAVGRPLRDLRDGLDGDRWQAAIGASKDLVEAASKLVLTAVGAEVPKRAPLPTLVARAQDCLGIEKSPVARSMTAVVQRLAEQRNASGSGHGQVDAPAVSAADARLAAHLAVGVAAYLLAGLRNRGGPVEPS